MKSTIIFNNTRDENNRFKTGYIVTIGLKYVTVQYLTNICGQRDLVWRVSIREWDNFKGDNLDKCLLVANCYTPVKRGEVIV